MQVGNIDLSGLITVLDESGNLKWNRAFKSPQEDIQPLLR
jgi:hypothetical protein